MLGVLYHTKLLEKFMKRKAEKKWEMEMVEMAGDKTMGIVGYGDIGSECAKIAKLGFGMRTIGIKRNPKSVDE